MKSIILLITALFIACVSGAQTGGITGVVSDARIGPLIYAQVSVNAGGNLKYLVLTDYDGRFLVRPLAPGNYDVTVTYKGQRDITRQVTVASSGLVTVNVSFTRSEDEEAAGAAPGPEEHVYMDGTQPEAIAGTSGR